MKGVLVECFRLVIVATAPRKTFRAFHSLRIRHSPETARRSAGGGAVIPFHAIPELLSKSQFIPSDDLSPCHVCRDDGIICPWFFSLEARGSLYLPEALRQWHVKPDSWQQRGVPPS